MANTGNSKRGSASRSDLKVIEVRNIDYTILITVILLVLIGIVMVFSSSYYVASTSSKFGNNMYSLVRSQSFAAIIGVAAMLFMSNINYRYLKRFGILFYIVSIILLIITSLFGKESGGARRWLPLPIPGLTQFQPSELAKISIILFVAQIISTYKNSASSLKGLAFLGGTIGICAGIIAVGTSNLSTAIIITIIGAGMIFIASPYTAIFVIVAVLGVVALVILLATGTGYRSKRFTAWLDPFSDPTDKGFQTIQSLYAIASGGIFGLGLTQSRQKLGFIPEAHNDIIFSIICEELGLVGAGLVLFLFGVLLWRILKTAINAPDLYGSLVAAGVGLMIGSQVLVNIAVVTNSIPNTGVPLPFISHGGTSIAILLFSVGIVLNISRYSKG